MDLADKLNAQIRVLFVLNAAGFFLWQSGDGLAGSAQIGGEISELARLVSIIGFAIWVIALFVVLGQTWRAKRLGVYDVLSDEWAQRARARAGEAGFWIVTVGVVLAMTATNFGIDGQLLLKALTGLAVAGYLGAYVWFDSRHEGEE
ncbi:MAG: hypothetical protein ABL308_12000 [Oceanicaulis sp.]